VAPCAPQFPKPSSRSDPHLVEISKDDVIQTINVRIPREMQQELSSKCPETPSHAAGRRISHLKQALGWEAVV
jgi:hypothetical protein